MPARLGFVVQEGLDPGRSVATDHALLAAARALPDGVAGVLRVFECAGMLVSLGRYHTAPPATDGPVRCSRRVSGGRVVSFGKGFIGVALVVADPLALRPEQVLNRYVRGMLEGCKLGGVPAFYPGRDTLTLDGRMLGVVSFEVDAQGALLVEGIIARSAEFASLAARLETVDPAGVVQAGMLGPAQVTSLAVALGRVPPVAEVADWMRRGYEKTLLVECVPLSVVPVEQSFDEAAWLRARAPRGDLDRRGTVTTQLGVVQAELGVDAGRLRAVRIGGDIIASSSAIAALETALAGCPADAAAIAAVVHEVFARPGHFVLGVGPLQNVTDAIVRAVPA